MYQKISTSILLLLFTMTSRALNYTVSFEKVKSHYVSVAIDFDTKGKDYINFKVPVWTPGSYKVREFSKGYENVQVAGATVTRSNKNTWQIATNGAKQLSLTYEVYCFEISARESYADENYAFLHSVSAFGYLEGYENERIILTLIPHSNWKNVEIALPQTKAPGHVFSCQNYDLLADSPVALGSFDTVKYNSGGVPHTVVMVGHGNYDLEVIRADFKKISDSQIAMMGEHPSERYTHFIYNVGSGGGGLEHLNSQTSVMQRWAYTNAIQYRSFLGLVAHEYFHLWNIKRIRPMGLGPFEYDKEVYTDMLWIAEGITSYYDDLTLLRIGKMSEGEYLNVLSSQINRLENTPGKKVMSLAHSSILAWIKGYLPNEESVNQTVSYYNKGMIAALLLDLEIRSNSSNSLDDVMTALYATYFKEKDRGFTHEEFIAVCSQVAGRDLQSFFDHTIFSTKALDYATILGKFGLEIQDENAIKEEVWSGVISKQEEGKIIITTIYSESPAVSAGLSVNDEILAVDGWRMETVLERHDNIYQPNDVVTITYARDGKIYTTKLIYKQSPKVSYTIRRVDQNNTLYDAWLR